MCIEIQERGETQPEEKSVRPQRVRPEMTGYYVAPSLHGITMLRRSRLVAGHFRPNAPRVTGAELP